MTDKRLMRIAKGFRDGLIKDNPWTALRPEGAPKSWGMCFQVSAALQGYLSAIFNVDSELESVDFMEINHTFLRLPDGRILDATADQFGLEPVYLGELPSQYREWMDDHAMFVARAQVLLQARLDPLKAERAKASSASEAQKSSNDLSSPMREREP